MKKKILSLLLIGLMVLGLTGCETEEEKLQSELEKNEQSVRDAIKEYNDLNKNINDYYKYKNAADNAKRK